MNTISLTEIIDNFNTAPKIYSNMVCQIINLTSESGSSLNINIKNKLGKTILMKACKNQSYNLIDLLLKLEYIDVTIKDNNGYNALMYLCFSKIIKLKCINLFLKKIAINNSCKSTDNTKALIYLLQNSFIDKTFNKCIIQLVKISDLTYIDDYGNTAYNNYMHYQYQSNILDESELHILKKGHNNSKKSKLFVEPNRFL